MTFHKKAEKIGKRSLDPMEAEKGLIFHMLRLLHMYITQNQVQLS